MNCRPFIIALFLPVSLMVSAQKIFRMEDYGIRPDRNKNLSATMQKALQKIQKKVTPGEEIVLRFSEGRYDFYPEGAAQKTYYVSNHDQPNPKAVGIPLEGFENMTLEGNGAAFVFHGTMLPLSLVDGSNCTLKDFSIDFAIPHITQVEIVKNEGTGGITFRPAPWVKYSISPDSIFESYGEGWKLTPASGIAFEPDTRHILYNTGDLSCNTKGVRELEKGLLHAPLWQDRRLKEGTIVAMRSWDRPTPGVFIHHSEQTRLENIQVHYAQGMGLLAQLCDSISLQNFQVSLKGENDPRYFTTQADATHFSQCKGLIRSVDGLYEGMMDDAINVHGVYLKVIKRVDSHTLEARYMHGQAWGFDWGYPGDEVAFIRSTTMEYLDERNEITSIRPLDAQADGKGMRSFEIRFSKPLPEEVGTDVAFGIENMTWTPEVYFAGNTIRNNRARGSLFSTPKKTVVENNLFDHTSGSAILLCGDCNGWYETGACKDVVIRNNKFVNALTSMYQFTNAVISIYPEIPDLKNQVKYFHQGSIIIENNEFDHFDYPLLYAKSVDGLVFRNNRIRTNSDYKPFHWIKERFFFEKVNGVKIKE